MELRVEWNVTSIPQICALHRYRRRIEIIEWTLDAKGKPSGLATPTTQDRNFKESVRNYIKKTTLYLVHVEFITEIGIVYLYLAPQVNTTFGVVQIDYTNLGNEFKYSEVFILTLFCNQLWLGRDQLI